MKLVVLAMAVVGLFSTGAVAAYAQDGAPPPQAGGRGFGPRQMDPKHRVDMLAKRLKLTDVQKQQLLPVLEDESQQMKALREDTSLDRKAKFEKMQTIREDSNTKILAALNDDQKQKYTQMQEQMKERMGHRMPPPGDAPNQ